VSDRRAAKPGGLNLRVTLLIESGLFETIVCGTVDLNDERKFPAEEVDDVSRNASLTAKLPGIEAARAEQI
jgi:hypothetical protein